MTSVESQSLIFEAPWVLKWGTLGVFLIMPLVHLLQLRSGIPARRSLILVGLRMVAAMVLVFLGAKPGFEARRRQPVSKGDPRRVVVMLDESRSMGAAEGGAPPIDEAFRVLKEVVLPALAEMRVPVSFGTFSESYTELDAIPQAIQTHGNGTDLANSIQSAFNVGSVPPMAVIALTDGVLTRNASESEILSRMVAERVPFVGLGFGRDRSLPTLSIADVSAPEVVAPDQPFDVALRIDVSGTAEVRPFDVLLLREGVEVGRRTVSRSEGFVMRSPAMPEGTYRYSVKIEKDEGAGERVLDSPRQFRVDVKGAPKLDVLFAQGNLGWDYKFIQAGVGQDSLIRFAGITRTRDGYYFRYASDAEAFLPMRLPSSVDQYGKCRVVILCSLVDGMIDAMQAQALSEFVTNRGGGLILLGLNGVQDSFQRFPVLQGLLPMVKRLERVGGKWVVESIPFRPVGQRLFDRPRLGGAPLGGSGTNMFPRGLVLLNVLRGFELKSGAQILATARGLKEDGGVGEERPFLIEQRVGNGRVLAINAQGLWRLRMGSTDDCWLYDSFWRKLIRHAAAVDVYPVRILFPDGLENAPGRTKVGIELMDSTMGSVDKPLDASVMISSVGTDTFRSLGQVKLDGKAPSAVSMGLDVGGRYAIKVKDSAGVDIGWKEFSVSDSPEELRRTARDMTVLERWAAVTRGVALRGESARGVPDFERIMKARLSELREPDPGRRPFDYGWVVSLMVVGALSGEWVMRKQWKLR
jgi:hypothetical protein